MLFVAGAHDTACSSRHRTAVRSGKSRAQCAVLEDGGRPAYLREDR